MRRLGVERDLRGDARGVARAARIRADGRPQALAARAVGDEGACEQRAARSRGARVCTALAHPAIVRLYDFVERRRAAHARARARRRSSRSRAWSTALRACGDRPRRDVGVWYVGYRIFLALAAAHSARDPMTRELAPVIHRDVCPGNVLVPWDGYVKLSDFGVARLAGVARRYASRRRQGHRRLPGARAGAGRGRRRCAPTSTRRASSCASSCCASRGLPARAPRASSSSLGDGGSGSRAARGAATRAARCRSPTRSIAVSRRIRSRAASRPRRWSRGYAASIDVDAAREQLVEKIARLRGAKRRASRSVIARDAAGRRHLDLRRELDVADDGKATDTASGLSRITRGIAAGDHEPALAAAHQREWCRACWVAQRPAARAPADARWRHARARR